MFLSCLLLFLSCLSFLSCCYCFFHVCVLLFLSGSRSMPACAPNIALSETRIRVCCAANTVDSFSAKSSLHADAKKKKSFLWFVFGNYLRRLRDDGVITVQTVSEITVVVVNVGMIWVCLWDFVLLFFFGTCSQVPLYSVEYIQMQLNQLQKGTFGSVRQMKHKTGVLFISPFIIQK